MEIKINKLQNEEAMKAWGVALPKVGDVVDFPVIGFDETYWDRYELKGNDGKIMNGIPVAYGKDTNGNDYLVCYWKKGYGLGAFKKVRKY